MNQDIRDRAPKWITLSILGLIVYSIVTTCLETMPELAAYEKFFWFSEVVVVLIFTVEFFTFWILSREGLRYLFHPLVIIDLLVILPFYLGLGIDFRIARSLRLLRIFRVMRIGRYSQALQTLGLAFKRTGAELVMVGCIAALIILISAMLLYYVEHDAQPEVYSSIPASLWWAVVTLTTVGYGDVYPSTVIGKIVASVIMLVGIGLVAIPAGLLSSTLTDILRERRDAMTKAENESNQNKSGANDCD